MIPKHFDVAANEARIRQNFVDGLATAMSKAPTPGDRALVALQGRLIDTTVIPIVEAMRCRNEKSEPDLIVEVLAGRVVDALVNICGICRVAPQDVFDRFATKMESRSRICSTLDAPAATPTSPSTAGCSRPPPKAATPDADLPRLLRHRRGLHRPMPTRRIPPAGRRRSATRRASPTASASPASSSIARPSTSPAARRGSHRFR